MKEAARKGGLLSFLFASSLWQKSLLSVSVEDAAEGFADDAAAARRGGRSHHVMMMMAVRKGLRDGNWRDAEGGRGDQGQKKFANLRHRFPLA